MLLFVTYCTLIAPQKNITYKYMYYFYDFKEKKLKGQIDEDKRFIVTWAEKGCVTKFKILNLKYLNDFYPSLNSSYSRTIHVFPPQKTPWVSYSGLEGDLPQNLNTAVQNINWNEDYYATVIERSACGFRMNILPKSPAVTEYQLFKPSIGLTKILVRISDGKIVNQKGHNIKEAIDYYNQMIQTDQFDI